MYLMFGFFACQSFWEDVREEMIEEKGLDPVAADKIGHYVKLNGGLELVEQLLQDPLLPNSKSAVEGLEGMKTLLKYCHIFGVLDKVSCSPQCCEASSPYELGSNQPDSTHFDPMSISACFCFCFVALSH